MPVSAQDTNVRWVESRFEDVREGYQSLQWNAVDGAANYRVLDAEGQSYYDGSQNEAFISGLPDGEHSFDVQAFSADGDLIAASGDPAVIVVQHWSMTQAWSLFGIGLVVFVVMIGAIVVGSRNSSRELAVESEASR